MVSGSPEVRKEAEDAGANAFVEKSLDMASLRNCVRERLRG
jgi:hypothetical protein